MPEPKPDVKYYPLQEQSPSDANRKAGFGMSNVLQRMEFDGYLALETDSVYGAVIALPQIARSVRWNPIYSALAFRAYLLLAINLVLQGLLISYISEAQIMDTLAGKMHLCDYGREMAKCPDGPHCTGPGGTTYTRTGLYSFNQWSVRNFVRDMLLAIDENKTDLIESKVLPGEYGMESYSCRLVVCFLFTMSITTELFKSYELARVLYKVPTKNLSWIEYVPLTSSDKEGDFVPLKLCNFHISGMPLTWKILNVVIVLVPKVLLWAIVVWEGFRFIMETAGIFDLVLGSIAMSFILSIDELVLDCLGTSVSRHIMADLTDHPLFEDPGNASTVDDSQDVLDKVGVPLPLSWWEMFCLVIPRRLFVTIVLLCINRMRYYALNCHMGEEGSYVSNPLYLPYRTTATGNLMEMINLFLFQKVDHHDEPFWTAEEQ
jgi:hypothetical protein